MSLDSGDIVDAEPSRQGHLNFYSPGGKFLATGPVYCGAVYSWMSWLLAVLVASGP